MNKKELIKLLDKYEIEYEITDNTKEVEEGLRLLDEALEKIGIIIPKETQVDTITTENDTEVPKYTTEWASSSDLISRQGAINAIPQTSVDLFENCRNCELLDREQVVDILESLPPVVPKRPKREWVVYPLVDNGRVELECPECGDTFIRAIDYRPHFCENCGADMRGDKE